MKKKENKKTKEDEIMIAGLKQHLKLILEAFKGCLNNGHYYNNPFEATMRINHDLFGSYVAFETSEEIKNKGRSK